MDKTRVIQIVLAFAGGKGKRSLLYGEGERKMNRHSSSATSEIKQINKNPQLCKRWRAKKGHLKQPSPSLTDTCSFSSPSPGLVLSLCCICCILSGFSLLFHIVQAAEGPTTATCLPFQAAPAHPLRRSSAR